MESIVEFYDLIALATQPCHVVFVTVGTYLGHTEVFQIDDGHQFAAGILGGSTCSL